MLMVTFFSQKSFSSKITGLLVMSALVVQLLAPLTVAYAVDEETPAVVEQPIVTEVVPEVPGEVLGEVQESTEPVVQDREIALPTATLVATKIVCDVESDLPDLAATNTAITATTATDFLAEHPNCRAQEGWNFQWAYKDVGSPGDNKQMGAEGWNLIGPTDANGTVTATIPVSNDIGVREERRAGYIGFSGIDNHHNGVSAEMVCTTPPAGAVHRYDNREPLGTVVEGGTYYCVAFNPIVADPQAPVCDANVNLIQNGDFEAPAIANGSYSIVPSSNPLLKWLLSWITPPANGTLGLELQNNVAGSPFSGNQLAELDGDHPVTIYQNITTIPGKEYKLDFQYSARPGRDTNDNKIDVKVDNVVLGAQLAADGTSLSDTSWQAQSRTFVATGTTTKVEFADAGTDTSFGGYLDAVSVRCQGDPVPPTPTVTIRAQKVICNSEANLPNWGNGSYSNITGTTAADYVAASNGQCRLEPNWEFQWGDQSAGDLGNGVVVSTPGYTTFNAGSVNIPLAPGMTEIHLREVLKDGYIPFTGQNTTQNVSAEFYCTGDALNYDNWDFIRNPVANTTYHCVAFNTPTPVVQTDTQDIPQRSIGTVSGFMTQPNTLGEVLGASTEAVDAALAQCGEYLGSYIKMGQKNKAGDVIRLQAFLNKYLGTKLVPRGVYDKATFDAVRAFQVQTADEVLEPWKGTPGGINENGTGYVYKTTKRMINMIMCPELNIEMPELE